VDTYAKSLEVRWSDLDPNFHLRHSVYYDWGAYVRLTYLSEAGFTPAMLLEKHIGPILFREECIFKREVVFGDKISVTINLLRSRRDASRWSMQHEIFKNGDILAALLTVDGAWIDTSLRKLAIPPPELRHLYDAFPKSPDFTWEEAR
jgi:acyl-CoA thioester hydrolase